MPRFFALTFRGLEQVSAEEIAELPDIRVETVGYRRVAGTCSGSLQSLLALRTVDDVFLHAASWSALEPQRTALARLRQWAGQLDLRSLVTACATVRDITVPPTFSVSASFVGKRNYTAQEIKEAVAQAVGENYGWPYTLDDNSADINIRVFIEHDTAEVGVRLGRAPLHHRAYRQTSQPGSLKPPVAAALVRLAGLPPQTAVIDPCCGSGIIPIEAISQGFRAYGGDIEAAALGAARQNAAEAGFSISWARWDARRLPFAAHSMPCIVSNLPWGKQVQVDEPLQRFYADVCGEICRVIAPGGVIVLLTSLPHLLTLVEWNGLHRTDQFEISLFGQTPSVVIYKALR